MMAASPITGSKRLSDLVAGMVWVSPGVDRRVSSLAVDSRRVAPGGLFLACRGQHRHGLDCVGDAVARGALAVLFDSAGEPPLGRARAALPSRVPLLAVPGLTQQAGSIAARFFDHPSGSLRVIGITGTNGKTSCAHMLAEALAPEGGCGMIGTLGVGMFGSLQIGTHTTPDPVALQTGLANFVDLGARSAVMEVSSHGLDQARVRGVEFDVAVLTNLSRDHLDYHGTMESYAAAKRRLFKAPGLRQAVLNLDDPYGRSLLLSLDEGIDVIGYGFRNGAQNPLGSSRRVRTVIASSVRCSCDGIQMMVQTSWGEGQLTSSLLGRFNAPNLLGVLATVLASGVPLGEALARLSRLQRVPGRMERVEGGSRRPLLVVDYAHTPDALAQALSSLRELCAGELYCVLGCGGERDRGKRPLMGAVAERGADWVILTNDNPRNEDAARIIADILDGIRDRPRVSIQPERVGAIETAIARARAGDAILIAGKGHESYQIIADKRMSFSDREVARRALAGLRVQGIDSPDLNER
jgi:UDP-N-acetylmuramoyl-L-alanyl-D-glutamate--2,6-diaminopimelate ligase